MSYRDDIIIWTIVGSLLTAFFLVTFVGVPHLMVAWFRLVGAL